MMEGTGMLPCNMLWSMGPSQMQRSSPSMCLGLIPSLSPSLSRTILNPSSCLMLRLSPMLWLGLMPRLSL